MWLIDHKLNDLTKQPEAMLPNAVEFVNMNVDRSGNSAHANARTFEPEAPALLVSNARAVLYCPHVFQAELPAHCDHKKTSSFGCENKKEVIQP